MDKLYIEFCALTHLKVVCFTAKCFYVFFAVNDLKEFGGRRMVATVLATGGANSLQG